MAKTTGQMAETTGNPKQRREAGSSPPIVLTMSVNTAIRNVLLKVKTVKLYSVIFVLCGCMLHVKVLLKINTRHLQILLNLC